MVYHVNPFSDIGSPGGATKRLYTHWRDVGTKLAKQRIAYEKWAWALSIIAAIATLESATRSYAVFGFLISGVFIYRAIACRIEEGTIETLLNRWDLDCAIELLIEEEKEQSEARRYELRRPDTEAESLRRGEFARRLESSLKSDE
jgi:hypothetical protein